MVITYQMDLEKLHAIAPGPLEVSEPQVTFEFIRMPDSTGLDDNTESIQINPVSLRGCKGIIPIACCRTIILRLPAAASSGVFRRSSPIQV
jgi:acetoacetate decarboxylase